MKNIIVVGSLGHAEVIVDILLKSKEYNFVGYVDKYRPKGIHVLGYPILGTEEDLPKLIANHKVEGIAIGIGDNYIRGKVADRIKELCPELEFITVIHPSAIIGTDVTIGEGSVVLAGAIINASTTLNRFCILNTNASIDHNCVMEEFSSLGPAAVVAGDCTIGKFTAVCLAAIVREKTSIGEHTIIGAGSLVLKSFGSHKVVYGSPAKVKSGRHEGNKYL